MRKKLSLLMVALVAIAAFAVQQVTRRTAADVTDALTLTVTGVTGTVYTEFSGKTATSNAVYAGQCAGGNDAIQLRSNNNNSGVVTTVSGGKLKSVKITWNSNTAATRTLSIYGKNTAYTAATDLYNADNQGTLLGDLNVDDATERVSTLTVDGDYTFVGIRSKSGAMYIDKIEIVWSAEAVSVEKPTISGTTPFVGSTEVTLACATEGAAIRYTLDGTDPTAESTLYEAPFSLTETKTVKAIAIKGSDVSAIASKEFVALPVVENIAALNKLADKAEFSFSGEALVTYKNGSYCFIKDATGVSLLYGSTPEAIAKGKTIAANWTGKVSIYNNWFEAVPNTGIAAKDGDAVEVAYDAVETVAAADMNKIVVLKGVKAFTAFKKNKGTGDDARQFSITKKDGETLVGFNRFLVDTEASEEGATYNITGAVSVNGETVQFLPIEIAKAVFYNVTVAEGITGGTVEVSPAKAEAGDEVTITATPAEGYKLLSLSVKNGEEYVAVSGSKFTMPAGNVTVSAKFAQPEDITIAAADITDGDITKALATATTDKIAKNITINLAENGAYTVSAPIEATASIAINGAAGAKIDASALAKPFINYASVIGEKAKKADESASDYTIVNNVKVADVEITGLAQSFINNSAGKILFKQVLVDNVVAEFSGSNSIFALGNGYPEDLKITNSTLWAKGEGHKGFLFQAHGKAVDINADYKTSWTVDKSTLYQIAVGKKANNTNVFKGKNYLVMTLTNSILYNFGSNAGNEVNGWLFGQNSTSPTITYANNAYLNADGAVSGWTDATKSGSDQTGTSVAGVITFTDAANADFNGTFKLAIGATAPEGKVGDPRWNVAYKESGAVLWSSEEPATIGWGEANITVAAEKFANAKVGDVMHVMLQDVKVGTNTWDAQVELRGQNWKALEGAAFVAGTESAAAATSADFVLTGDILAIAKAMGVQINGTDCKTALITLEYADKVAGSDVSIWVGNATKANIALNKAHFANSNLFGGIKVGDKIRLTVKKTDPEGDEWIGLNYQSPTWAWSEFAEGSFATTVTPTEDGAIVDYEVKTAEVAQILNVDNAQIIVNNPNQTVTQVELIVAPVDIVINPESGADIYAALKAETDKVAKVGNITINLAANGAYTLSDPIEVPAGLTINGAAGAKIDASTLAKPMIQMSATPSVGQNEKEAFLSDGIIVKNVTISGLKYQLIYGNKQKYLLSKVEVDDCVIAVDGTNKKTVIDFNGGGNASEVIINNSTLWANPALAQAGGLFSSQSGHGSIQDLGSEKQLLAITNSTIYNISYKANTCSQRRNNTAGMEYKVENSVIVNSGKSGQFVVGLNGGGANAAQTYTINNNVFNFDGADVSAAEQTKVQEKIADKTLNSIAGVVTFTDAAAGNFAGSVELPYGATAPETKPGDPRWTLTFTNAPQKFAITVAETTNGTATVDKAEAAEGEAVIITVTPAEGYELDAITGVTATAVEGEANKYQFTMGAEAVTVTVTFKPATGISNIAAEKLENQTIYNLRGQRVEKAQKGLYIVNGKKVVIK